MKKLLFVLLALSTLTLNAQKNDFKKFKQKINAKIAEVQKHNANGESRAAYLQDSIKLYDVEDSDSTLFGDLKFKYLPDGRVTQADLFINFFGFILYQRAAYAYDAKKTNQLNYIENYDSEDGIDYTKFTVDSFFYDTKDRVRLTTTTGADDNATLSVTEYKYNTNFAEADTTRSRRISDITQMLELDREEFRTIDAKGNVTLLVIKAPDFATNEYDLSEKTTYVYDAQNRLIKEDGEDWNVNESKWEKVSQDLIKYNTQGSISSKIGYSDWDETEKVFLEKDSTAYTYTASKKPNDQITFFYDENEKEYSPTGLIHNEYDKNDNLIREEESDYNKNEQKFQLIYLTKTWWSFYKDAINSSKDIFSNDYKINVANPIQENVQLSIVAKKDGIFNLLAYDTNGKIVAQQRISNGENKTFSLPASGQYILILTDEKNKPLTMRKVVKM